MTVFQTASGRLIWRGDGETLVVEPWGRHSLRVRATRAADVADTDFALLPRPPADAEIVTEGNVARLTNGNITAVLTAEEFYDAQAGYDVSRCSLAFHDRHGDVLLRELGSGGSLKLKARAHRAITGGPHHLTASFEARPDEKLYGMGQYQQDMLNLKGCTLELAHRNSQVSVPFVLSSAGYGFLWHNPAIGRATFGTNRTEWVAESTRQLDYWITAGDTPAEITAAYAEATGHVPMMPEYGLGLWQSKLRYWNQEQLLEVAREYHRRGLPLDVLVADFFHWPKMGDFRFEDEFWPDPDAMVAELRELGIELMVSVWPQVSVESENFREFRRHNLLVGAERGPDVQMSFQGPSMFLDVTNPAAREALWELCRRNYHSKGIRVFWLDEAEPEYGVYDFDNYRYHLGPALEVGNLYPQAFSRALSEGQRAAGQEDVVNLVRCAWAGSQRYGALVWSGDIHCDFDTMRKQITAGVNMGIAGIPWFTTDIGGFHGGDITDPGFHELLIRWFQFGTFCPVMRMHGDRQPTAPVRAADGTPRCPTGADNELWAFGEDVYDVLTRYLRLREALRPYTRRLMSEAHRDGQPVMRAMFHEFPDDPACWDLADQYMFGGDLLVAPVTSAGADSREVYLPQGATWTDLGTGTRHKGGRYIRAAAPLEVIPVFARDDALAHLVGLV
ncbi:glycoside hydrolase family 31 protein [Streptomyces litchfieldiae]|uniref:Glycoside hydrolase family 31 protein n=1 Tax=Streptomyces litchfieldiae TaxID=3075543 RepID=A0ABU2MS49_9ACTN|nr:TIM-barrel domain-containing protein [Streptomyces sp. DSM 44938]MDT0343919.1 glycoside hydrolase family 31 protein [Streptomyces sp. DSM 44938]